MHIFDYSFLDHGMIPARLVNFAYIDFREKDVLQLHEMLMSIAGDGFGGQYKTDDNVILEIDDDGSRRVRFRPTPTSRTEKAMEQLELAYMEARNNANVNQLLLIPCVILDFLCIHPFRDGNGKKITKKARIEATILNSLTPLSKAEICKILPDVSPATVQAVLGKMVKNGAIKPIGGSRATRYFRT